MIRASTAVLLAWLSLAARTASAGDVPGPETQDAGDDADVQEILDDDLDTGGSRDPAEPAGSGHLGDADASAEQAAGAAAGQPAKKPKKKLWSWLVGPVIDWDASFQEEVALPPSITLTSRRPQSPFETAAAADLITASSIKEAQAFSVAQALVDVPGLSVIQPMHASASPVARGLLGQRVALLFDGIRLEGAGTAPGPSLLAGLVDTYGLDSIEVVRGPSPVLAGPFALGGAVNFVPALPLVNPLVSYRSEAWILYRYGSADTSQVLHANLEFQVGDVATVADFGYSVLGPLQDGANRVPFTGYDAVSFHFATRKLIGDTGDLLFFYGTSRLGEAYQGLGTAGDLPVYLKWPHLDTDLLYIRLSAAPAGLERLELTLGMHMLPSTSRLYQPGEGGGEDPSWEIQHVRSTTSFVTGWGRIPIGAWGSLLLGMDYYLDMVDAHGTVQSILGSDLQIREIDRPALPDGAMGHSLEPHVLLDIRATSALQLSLGTRLWYHRLDPGSEETGRDIVGGSGVLGGRFAVGSMASLVVNISYGTRPPTMFEVAGEVCGPGSQVPSPGLDPEGALGAELGFKWDAGILDRAVVPLAVEPLDRCGLPGAVRYANSGKAWLHSIEFRNQVNLLGLMTIGTVLGWYHGTLEGTHVASGGPMPWIPPLMGTAFLRVSYLKQYLWADLRLRFAIAQDRNPSGYVPAPSENDPFFLLSLRGGVALGGSIRLFLAFENILNQVHRWYGSGLDGPGRSVLVGIEGHL